ncbi:ABC transporter permease [Peptoniphilus genitalis]|uniref:ABC transporter permease n=1 Tax=Peptoniphilus genitalis TaxID=3036303 RepID=A0ABY4TQE2_9FIRM|nr:ABC transporter permease [Peptoniphilus sp. SAHP1]URN40824.1 ABC transporter permease [Peptoniphilus sp. SAHP1]
MSRAIKLELYRLRRNKYPWIILILSSLMIIGSVYMTKVDYHYYINDKAALENLKINFTQINWGIYVGSVIPDWLDLGYIPITELFMRNIQSKILLMFQTVFIVMYIGDEIKSSFLKNINQVFQKKIELTLGKVAIICVYTLAIFITSFIIMSLSFYFMEGYLKFTEIGIFIKYILTEYLLYITYSIIIMFLAYLIRNSAVTLIIGLLESAGILQIIDTIFHQISGNLSFSIMNYLISGNIVLLSIDSSDSIYLRVTLLSIIYLIIMIILNIMILSKRDIY